MDDKALVAGTRLFLPVYVAGAPFQVGDGHAGQGNGEVEITELVDRNKGVHVVLPKVVFLKR